MPEDNNGPAAPKTPLEQAEEARKEAEAEAGRAKAEKDAIEAALQQERLLATRELGLLNEQVKVISGLVPKGDTKPLEGTIKTEKPELIPQQIAYRTLRSVAIIIAEAVQASLLQ